MDDEITPEDVNDLLDSDGSPTVVDIRQPPAFARGHIPGSVNVPFPELPNRVSEFEEEAHIVTVCPHGKSSVQAARLIKSYEGTGDARVESMSGGLSEWEWDLETAGEESDEGPQSPF